MRAAVFESWHTTLVFQIEVDTPTLLDSHSNIYKYATRG